jgi:tetratricopeptide (TPR) repeat protein/predicted Ser/Thr protein kinase
LGQRYLQPGHASELGQLYHQVCADPSLLEDSERTMEFSASLPLAPPSGASGSDLIQPASSSVSAGGTVITGLPAGVRPPAGAPLGSSAPHFAPPPSGAHGVLPPTQDSGTVYAAPPSTLTSEQLASSRESGPGAFVGPFRIVRELARGGMGVVYEAERPGLDRRVALKQMLGGGSSDAVERFLIEARIAARLRHPNIVGIHDVGEAEGNPYFAMDFIEGEDLDDRIKREGALPLQESAELIKTLAEALAYAHERAVLHRDIKPANVLLNAEGGVPILTDFGLAKDVGQAGDSGLTQDGAIMGTPSYMPPEQAEGAQALIDRRADIYSLGATLYACLVAKPPFEGNSPMNTITRLLTEEVVRPRKLRAEVPRDLEVICLKCLEKEPEARYQTSAELALDLGRYLADEPILARPPSSGERLAKWVRRNRKLTAVMVLSGLLFLAGTGGAWAYTRAQARSEGRGQAEAAWAAYEGADPGDRDERIGLALTALQQGQRWVALAPTDADARAQAFQAAVALGRVAEEGQQWAFAKQAYEQARAVDPSQAEVVAGFLGELEVKQNAELERRLRIVRGYLERARSGDYATDPLGLQDAEFGIVQYRDPEVIELLLEEVQSATEAIVAVRRELLSSLIEPEAIEAETGQTRLEDLPAAIEAWDALVRQGEPARETSLANSHLRALQAARARWAQRRLLEGHLRDQSARELTRDLLRKELGPRLTAVHLATKSLARLPLPPSARETLVRYINAEADRARQASAGVALCRMGTLEAARAASVLIKKGDWPDAAFAEALRVARAEHPELLPTNSLESCLEEANQHLAQIRPAQALELAELGLQRFPDSSELVEIHLAALIETGRLADAGRRLAELRKADPESDRLRFLELNLTHARGDKVTLRAELEKLETERLGPNTRIKIAELWIAVQCFDQAEAEYRAVLRQKPAPSVTARLARVMVFGGRAPSAAALLRSALAKSPSNLDLKLSLANAEREQGRLPEALALLNTVLEEDPSRPAAYQERGQLYVHQGQLRAALDDFSKGLEFVTRPRDRALFFAHRGQVYADLTQADLALSDLEAALALLPGDPEILACLARFQAARGKSAVAAALIDRAIESSPNDPRLRSVKGQILASMGRTEEAAKILSEMVERQPKDVRARGNLAVTLLQRGDFQGALVHLDMLLEATPENTLALLNRARVYSGLQRLPEAFEDLETVKRLTPKSARPYVAEAQIQMRLRKFPEMLQAADAGLKRDPRAGDAHSMRGLALLALQRRDESAAAFRLALSLDPDNLQIKLFWINFLLATNRHSEAKRVIKEILTKAPDHPEREKLKGLLERLGG